MGLAAPAGGLTPLHDLVVSTVLSSRNFADDTTLPVLDPGRGRMTTGPLWWYAVKDRPWRGPTHPVAADIYAQDHKGARPARHLAGCIGLLQVDGCAGFKRAPGDRAHSSITLALCWTHVRRSFFQFFASTKSPIAEDLLARMASLCAIEADRRIR